MVSLSFRHLVNLLVIASYCFFSLEAISGECLKDVLKKLVQGYEPKFYSHKGFAPKVGIEIEGWSPVNIDRKTLAKAIEIELLKRNPDLKINIASSPNFLSGGADGVDLTYTKDGYKYTYKLVNDVSIKHPSDTLATELVSPKIRTQHDLDDFKAVVGSLRKVGFTPEPLSSGTHVHVDFFDPTGAEAATLSEVFRSIEDDVVKRFGQTESRKTYATKTVNGVVDVAKESPKFSIEEYAQGIRRYHTLNLQSLFEHGTVEFRLFNSTLNTEAIETMVDFSQKLVRAVREQDPRLLNYMYSTKKPTLNGLAGALGLKLSGDTRILKQIVAEANAAKKLGLKGKFFTAETPSDDVLKSIGADAEVILSQAQRGVDNLRDLPAYSGGSEDFARRIRSYDRMFYGGMGAFFASMIGITVYAIHFDSVRAELYNSYLSQVQPDKVVFFLLEDYAIAVDCSKLKGGEVTNVEIFPEKKGAYRSLQALNIKTIAQFDVDVLRATEFRSKAQYQKARDYLKSIEGAVVGSCNALKR